MRLPDSVQHFLTEQHGQFDIMPCPSGMPPADIAIALGIPARALIRVVMLHDGNDSLMAMVPSNFLLNFDALQTVTGVNYEVVDAAATNKLFRDCMADSKPALPGAFQLFSLRDEQTLHDDPVYIEAGNGESILRFSQAEFTRLSGANPVLEFAESPQTLRADDTQMLSDVVLTHFLPMRLKQRVQETYDLPAMPEIAQDIMRLRVDTNASARDLAAIVNRDPSLAAQVMSWANSPYYGFSGRISSVEMAIMRVLGFEMVMNLALGISVGRALRVPHDGPLGLRAYWLQAVLSAVLAEKLCTKIDSAHRPQRGLVYLSGLLHNMGHLLLGHLFPPQFFLVNRYVSANPHVDVSSIEKRLLGVSHNEIGSWLLQSWHMPEEIISAALSHHHEQVEGDYATYAAIVFVANRLLARIGVGDECSTILPAAVLAKIHLAEADALAELSRLNDSRNELEEMATRMVA